MRDDRAQSVRVTSTTQIFEDPQTFCIPTMLRNFQHLGEIGVDRKERADVGPLRSQPRLNLLPRG